MAVTREEQYLAYLNGEDVALPEPVTRQEQYLYNLCLKGSADPEAIAEAVEDYLDTHGMALEIDEDGIIELGGE